MNTLRPILLLCAVLALPALGNAFCGFYVAKADKRLFNQASEVILARDGDRTVVTMSNDFQGDVRDFAMVVPVPVVLDRNDIEVVDRYIFDKLDAYSGPRLVEYHDQNPCARYELYNQSAPMGGSARLDAVSVAQDAEIEEEYSVTIEAEYTVGEYDILILSAEESDGLKRWLTDNDYTIPDDAHEVLDPYIRNGLKFFVVKVNLDEQEALGFETLRPIRIRYESKRFMLPIRLGMANADGPQDLIIYAMTPKGRVETTNYRTVEIPTDKEIPTFVEDQFGPFYADLFTKAYKRNQRESVFVEYAWDLSSSNYTKCDPCATTPPTYGELADAGVSWVEYRPASGWQGTDYEGDVFFTRLHVRYDREHFPMDLQFQTTPNRQSFQGRYVMNHMVEGRLDCSAAAAYYRDVLDRREGELDQLAWLTGWDLDEYDDYIDQVERRLDRTETGTRRDRNWVPVFGRPGGGGGPGPGWVALLLLTLMPASLLFLRRRILS